MSVTLHFPSARDISGCLQSYAVKNKVMPVEYENKVFDAVAHFFANQCMSVAEMERNVDNLLVDLIDKDPRFSGFDAMQIQLTLESFLEKCSTRS